MAKDNHQGRSGTNGHGRGGGGARGGAKERGDRGQGILRSSAGADRPRPSVPAGWPPGITYLATPVYAGISLRQRQLLQTQPADQPNASAATPPLAEIPSILRFGPSALVEIRAITDPAHPACGQRGLFAAKNLAPGSFVLPYLGVYHRGNVSAGSRGGTNVHNKRESDYDLWLDRDADVAVDADRQGNEARFVNDYRGTGKPRPNAEFREVWDPRRGERGMAVFVLPAGKRALSSGMAGGGMGGITKGEEILVSYGKGFWEMRQKEADAKTTTATTTAAATATVNVTDEPRDGPGTGTHAVANAPPGLEMPGQGDLQNTMTPHPATVDVQYISDRVGGLKVVAKIPRNVRFA